MVRHFKPRVLVGRYRSKSEERVAGHLNELGVAYDYEPKDKKLKYAIERTAYYLPDFVLEDSGIILEVKGEFTSSDRAKYLRIRDSNPSMDLRFVFDRATSKLSKKSKTTYAQWADKNGFLWCEKIIPPEWLQQKRAKNARTTSKASGPQNPPASRKAVHLSHGGTARSRHLSAVCKHP
jgi:hypothetical protein